MTIIPRWVYWFKGRVSLQYLPGPCVDDCTAPGVAYEATTHWIKRLEFDAPPWLVRQYLGSCGAYEAWELCDHQANLRRLLWLWAFECKDAGGPVCMYLGY